MMKRIFCLLLAVLLAGGLFGCHYSDSGDILEPVEFFYPRDSEYFVYGSADGVIAPEVREASGHTNDLPYLLSMYLRGPQDSALRSPFPVGCTLEEARMEDGTLFIRLSEEFSILENMELTLACAALAKTCLSMTDAMDIHINSQSDEKTVSMHLTADALLLSDHLAFNTQTAAHPPN